jgi:hypothetical protein
MRRFLALMPVEAQQNGDEQRATGCSASGPENCKPVDAIASSEMSVCTRTCVCAAAHSEPQKPP